MNIFSEIRLGLKILVQTLRAADWRLFVVAPAVILLLVGILPVVQPEAFTTGRFRDLRSLFKSPPIMMLVYSGSGFALLISLRKRRLAILLPLSIIVFGFYSVTQVAYGGLYYVVSTAILSVSSLVYAFVRGGGFIINHDVDARGLTERERVSLIEAEKMERVVMLSNSDGLIGGSVYKDDEEKEAKYSKGL